MTVVILAACSSAPRKNEKFLQRILLYNLHFRRPEQLGAKMHAVPGEEDYESRPRPNERFDCQPLRDLYKGMDLKAVRECMQNSNQTATLKNPDELVYRLYRDTTPYLLLQVPDDSETVIPECYQKVMNKIPVPREIFFQAIDDRKLDCFNSRIPVVPEEFLGIKGYLYKYKVKVGFPIESPPKTEEETVFLLATWSLMPFFDEDHQMISAKHVPSGLCRTCMGESHLYKDADPLPPFWPKLQ